MKRLASVAVLIVFLAAVPSAGAFTAWGVKKVGSPSFCTRMPGVWTRAVVLYDHADVAYSATRTMRYCTNGRTITRFHTGLLLQHADWSSWRMATRYQVHDDSPRGHRWSDTISLRNSKGETWCLKVRQAVNAAGWKSWYVSSLPGACKVFVGGAS